MKLWIDDVRPAPEDYYWVVSVNEASSKSFSESDDNPYDKYSYNSGLCYEDGSPCWGLDIKYCLHELKHGRNPYEFGIK